MYHPPSPKRQLIQRILIYGLMTIAVVGLVTALALFMVGYRFNSDDGSFKQGGLVQFASRPSGANITINGNDFGARTSTKATLTTGSHFITMNRPGYHEWQKTVQIEAGDILWLNYTRFVPTELDTSSVAKLSAATSTATSPNNETYAIWQAANRPVVTLADIRRDKVEVEDIELPEDIYSQPEDPKTQRFKLETWDPSSRYLLIKHSFDGTHEWLVVDTDDPERTRNITELLAVDAEKIVFSYDSRDVVYALIDNDVRMINLSAVTLSRPLLSDVAEFAVESSEMLSYVGQFDAKTEERTVGYYKVGSESTQALETYQDDGKKSLHVALGEYYDEQYQAVAYGSELKITKGELSPDREVDDALETIIDLKVPGNINHLSFKTSGRFVVAQTDEAFSVYDMELKKHTTTPLKGDAKVTKELVWLDNYHAASDRSGQLRTYEFDGANQHNLMEVVPGFGMTYGPDAEYVYGITQDENKAYHLSRTKLVID